ncbi:Signal recognition particle 19 kDa protein [uncultured archaeon]|nr:Signal recognition particle 19 kDa protein [uncultured archaeon]
MAHNSSTMPEKNKLVIWPIYFDAARSRSDGRMVPLQSAVSDPSLDMVITASLKAGFKPEIEREKRHPKLWHQAEAAGRILVVKNGPKSAVLKRIAASLKTKYKKKSR